MSDLELKVYQAADLHSILIENPGKSGNASVEIFSITGTLVYSSGTELLPGKNHLITGKMETGIYLYRISLKGTSNSGKLLITDH